MGVPMAGHLLEAGRQLFGATLGKALLFASGACARPAKVRQALMGGLRGTARLRLTRATLLR